MTANMKVGFKPSGHGQRAALLHGLKGVFDQIEKHLSELGPVAVDRWQARIEIFADLNFFFADGLGFEQKHVF